MLLDEGQIMLRDTAELPGPPRRGQDRQEWDLPGYRGETYYGLPALKPSHYGWRAGTGFFVEGVGSAALYIAAVADLAGNDGDRTMVRAGRYAAFAGSSACLLLFLLDLHTRSRWYNMLRMFRPTSAMSVGVWSLTKLGLLSGLTAGGQVLEDMGHRRAGRLVARLFQVPASLAAMVVSSYMGTEMEETSTPFWSRGFPFMPVVMAAANATAALSLMEALPGVTRSRSLDLRRLSTVTGSIAMAMLARLSVAGRRRTYRPFPLLIACVVLLGKVLPLALRLTGGAARALSAAGGIAVGCLVPGLLLHTGNASGQDPQAYFRIAQPGGPAEKSGMSPSARGALRSLRGDGKPSLFRWGLVMVGMGIGRILARRG